MQFYSESLLSYSHDISINLLFKLRYVFTEMIIEHKKPNTICHRSFIHLFSFFFNFLSFSLLQNHLSLPSFSLFNATARRFSSHRHRNFSLITTVVFSSISLVIMSYERICGGEDGSRLSSRRSFEQICFLCDDSMAVRMVVTSPDLDGSKGWRRS